MERFSDDGGGLEKNRRKETAQQRLERVLKEIDTRETDEARACSNKLDKILDSIESEKESARESKGGAGGCLHDTTQVERGDKRIPVSGESDSERLSARTRSSDHLLAVERVGSDGRNRPVENEPGSGASSLAHPRSTEMGMSREETARTEQQGRQTSHCETGSVQAPREKPSLEGHSNPPNIGKEISQEEGTRIRVANAEESSKAIESVSYREDTNIGLIKRSRTISEAGPRPSPDPRSADDSSEIERSCRRQNKEPLHSEGLDDSVTERYSIQQSKDPEASIAEAAARRPSIDVMVERHPHLRDSPDFEEQLRLGRAYEKFVKPGLNDHESVERFAVENNVPLDVAASWGLHESRPTLIKSIEAMEDARTRYEHRQTVEALSHHIDSSIVYQCFRPLKDVDNLTNQRVADCIGKLCRECNHEKRIVVVQLHPYHDSGPMWMCDVGKYIADNLSEITRDVNTRLKDSLGSEEIRLGVDFHKLYIRWRDTDPYKWENLYSQEDFHFRDLEDKKRLIGDVCSHLMIASRLRLSKLVGQLSDYELTIHETNLNVDLGFTNLRLKGETLHLLSDVLGTRVAALQDKIDYIGRGKRGWGVIRNPNLETDPVDVISRLVGIVMSDGHIDPNCHITYPDAYPDRLARVRETVNMLGDVDMTEKVHSTTGVHYIHIPAVVGRLLVKAGMLTGDKAIQDERLPEIVRTAPNEAEAAYTKELTADDGCFAIDGRSGEFSWSRAIVLDAGNKSERYEHRPLISKEEIEFAKTHGEKKTVTIGGSKPTIVYAIKASQVKRLKKSSDPEVASLATKLFDTIESNPPRLMEDERQLCHNIGIATRRYPIALRVFESGRVSVFWQAQTSSYKDAMVWGLVATPNDARKSEKVSQWLSERIRMLLSEVSRSA